MKSMVTDVCISVIAKSEPRNVLLPPAWRRADDRTPGSEVWVSPASRARRRYFTVGVTLTVPLKPPVALLRPHRCRRSLRMP